MQEFSARLLLFIAGIVTSSTLSAQPETAPPATTRTQVRVSQLFGWQPLDSEHLLLWTGKEEVWRVGLAPECASLMKTRNIEVTTDSRHIKVGRDQIRTGKQSCTIREFALPDKQERRRFRNPRKGFMAELLAHEDNLPRNNNESEPGNR